MASNQSSAGEQGASFENGTPRGDGTRRKRPSEGQRNRGRLIGPFKAYLYSDELSKARGREHPEDYADVSKDTQRKRDERDEDDKNELMQYVVKVPKGDKAVKATIKAVAEAAVSESELYSAVAALVANDSLPEIVNSMAKTHGFGRLLVEISEREDLREFAEAAASNEELFSLLAAVVADHSLQEILRAIMATPGLAGLLLEISRSGDLRGIAETMASNAELFSAVAVLVAESSLQEIVRSASTAPGLAELLLEISRRDDLRKLAQALSANVALADASSGSGGG